MGRLRKTCSQYEEEAGFENGCLVHPAKTGGLVRRIYQERHGVCLPSTVLVCHTCDNPACILDRHHFLGSQKDNMEDMIRKGRGADRRGSLHPLFGSRRPDTAARNRATTGPAHPLYGKPVHPNLLAAQKKPKSEAHKAAIRAALIGRKAK